MNWFTRLVPTLVPRLRLRSRRESRASDKIAHQCGGRGSFHHRILNRDVFRIELSKPALGSVPAGEDLEAVPVANLFAGIDVDSDGS